MFCSLCVWGRGWGGCVGVLFCFCFCFVQFCFLFFLLFCFVLFCFFCYYENVDENIVTDICILLLVSNEDLYNHKLFMMHHHNCYHLSFDKVLKADDLEEQLTVAMQQYLDNNVLVDKEKNVVSCTDCSHCIIQGVKTCC